MNTRSFLILALVTVLVAGLAFMVLKAPDGSDSRTDVGSKLYPTLLDSINDVAKLTIENVDGKLTIIRDGDAWGLEEKHLYPVDLPKTSAMLTSLALMETVEEKTREPKRYAALGVEGLGDDSKSTLLTLEDANGKVLASLIVGQKRGGRASGDEVYVRKDGDAQTWLARAKLETDSDWSNWIDKKIAKIERARVQALSIEHSDGENVLISKANEDTPTFTVHDIPEGRELSYGSVADGMANTLEWLNLEDVVPSDEIELGDDWDTKTTFWTFDGLKIEATLTQKDGETWARFVASTDADGAAFVVVPEDPEDEESEAKEPDLSATAEAQAEAAKLQKRLSLWTYKLPMHSMTSLGKRMEQLLKPLPIEPEEGEVPTDEEWSDSTRIEDLLTPEQLEQLNAEHGTEFPVDKVDDGNE